MKNKRAIIILIAVPAVAAILFWLFSLLPERYNWNETYRPDRDEPYDLSLFKSNLENYFPEEEFVELHGLNDDTSYRQATSASMVYVNLFLNTDSTELERMIRFAERGNTLFISAVPPEMILHRLLEKCREKQALVKLVQSEEIIAYTDPLPREEVVLSYEVRNEPVEYPWSYFSFLQCEGMKAQTVGHFTVGDEEYPNYLKINAGSGVILIHLTPLVFTNFHFRKETVLEYAEDVLSQIPQGTIYFLSPPSDENTAPFQPIVSKGPLDFILSQEPLRWAWYGTLLLALLFVINGMRRDSRTIPVRELPKNQTARYLDVVYRMFRKADNHKHIIAVQFKLLSAFLRTRYRLHVANSDIFYREAAIRLEMEERYLRRFFTLLISSSHRSGLTDNELVELNRKINEFYTACP